MNHPTAKIHPTAIVEDGARVGARTIVMEFAIIRACVEVGEDCEIMERCVLGVLPFSYLDYKRVEPLFGVKVGNNIVFHMNSTVVSGMVRPTKIENGCAFGQQTTIGHDCKIGKRVQVMNHSTIGGFAELGSETVINLNCTIRNRIKIGPGSFIGMGSNVVGDIPSNVIAYGNPCRVIERRRHPISYYLRRFVF